jgi:capsular polysaccharide transport system ATP-binding protein
MIELVDITKAYRVRSGHNVVLNRVNFRFDAGSNTGILGKNGAGKSTLLRILSGAEQPDAGHIVRNGRVSWPIGFSGGFSPSLTGHENARFVARLYGADLDRVCGFALDFSELGEYFEMPVRTYSAGMRARLAFALSMAIDFDVYLVDEVTAVGDSTFQKKCREAFAERRGHASVIIVSHDLRTIQSYAERCAVLHRGNLIAFDNVADAACFYQS